MKKTIIISVVIMFFVIAGFIVSMSSSDFAINNARTSLAAAGANAASSTLSSTSPEPAQFKNYILTRAEDKTTLRVHPDDEILLRLGSGIWSVSLDNDTILTNMTNLPAIEGIQGILKAMKTGTVHVSAKNETFSISITIIVE